MWEKMMAYKKKSRHFLKMGFSLELKITNLHQTQTSLAICVTDTSEVY